MTKKVSAGVIHMCRGIKARRRGKLKASLWLLHFI